MLAELTAYQDSTASPPSLILKLPGDENSRSHRDTLDDDWPTSLTSSRDKDRVANDLSRTLDDYPVQSAGW